MKIEKISESQIKFILNQSDLSDRNIKINELAYGSEKMQALFRDMLEQAVRECGFAPENNVPLMIEAIPLSQASIMIIVTKVSSSDEFEQKLSLLPQSKDERRFVKRPVLDNTVPTVGESETVIYSFPTFDSLSKACVRLPRLFSGIDSLYKMNGRFYLILCNIGAPTPDPFAVLEPILSEYGQKFNGSANSRFYIMEHGDAVIKDGAIGVISAL